MYQLSLDHALSRIGAQELTQEDIDSLNASVRRVYDLLSDGNWHDAESIRVAARGSEGLRRMRELREYCEIQKRRISGTRTWEYRLERG